MAPAGNAHAADVPIYGKAPAIYGNSHAAGEVTAAGEHVWQYVSPAKSVLYWHSLKAVPSPHE